MALTRLATPVTGDTILPTTHFTAEFDNIYNNALTLISPLTGNLDVNNKQLVNMRVENVTATPTAAQAGREVWHTTFKQYQLDDGAQIRYVPALYGVTTGDLVYATSGSQFGRLAIGTANQVLQATGSAPAWTSALTLTSVTLTGALVVGGGSSVSSILKASGACVWPAFNSGATIATTIAVTGAAVGDTVVAGHTTVTAASVLISGYVSSANTVTVSLYNGTGAVLNPGSGTLKVTVIQ